MRLTAGDRGRIAEAVGQADDTHAVGRQGALHAHRVGRQGARGQALPALVAAGEAPGLGFAVAGD